jgi:NADH:ubiquinone oxidoreductase subunit F (NADH-binding)/(2Fe-2S) ferredoxin
LGALEILDAFREQARQSTSKVTLSEETVGCCGSCGDGPYVELPDYGVLYGRVSADDVSEIFLSTVEERTVVNRLMVFDAATGRRYPTREANPFFAAQNRRVLARCGVVNPVDIEHAIELGAYSGLRRVLDTFRPGDVVELIKLSGVRERGGRGFPVGFKWALVAEAPESVKYVVGNGEGGDPGLDVDRLLLESDPHGVLEGMVIAGYSVGASEGRLFVRSESGLAVDRAMQAVAQARRKGILGSRIFGSTFDFDIEVRESAGASMGGEETALLSSLQGLRAVARPRPPFPAASGLWRKPTLMNTLETLASIPLLVAREADRDTGEFTGGADTKVFGLAGAVARPGMVEVQLGRTVGEVVETLGGGVVGQRRLKAVHVGGPAGITLGSDSLDEPLDHQLLRRFDAPLGSGGLVVLDDTTCVVGFARYLVSFCARESCGTCPPCRIGTQVLLNLLDRVMGGTGDVSDVERLERLSAHIRRTSMCELGRNAPNPVISGLQHFRNEYEAHLGRGGCPAGQCSPVTSDT